MAFWNRLFGGGTSAPSNGTGPATPASDAHLWQRLLVPAVDQAYSGRSLEVAYRLARGTGATVLLAFVLEVPRSLALEATLPDLEAVAAEALHEAEMAAISFQIPVETFVHRTRNAREGILKLITQEKVDLLVLGARPDGLRGLPNDLTRELFQRSPCEVVLDYIAGEK